MIANRGEREAFAKHLFIDFITPRIVWFWLLLPTWFRAATKY